MHSSVVATPLARSLFLAIALALSACAPSSTDSADGGSGDGGEETTDACTNGGGEAPVGPCLVTHYAGTYSVSATSGTHTRGTIIIGADGSIDYDTGLDFGTDDYQGVYDRLECCNRISVEMNPRGDNDPSLDPGARHRVDIFTESSELGAAVTYFEYYPNWPSNQGMAVLELVN